MKKIPSLFMRNYETDRLVRNEVVPGSEWVLAGEGLPTIKIDGTACMIRDGQLYKRYDRKAKKKHNAPPEIAEIEYKPAPVGWEACGEPDTKTWHWPGWLPVGEGPEDQWHREAVANSIVQLAGPEYKTLNGTYELIGPKVQGNPYRLDKHKLVKHGQHIIAMDADLPGRAYAEIYDWLVSTLPPVEGIVWHHPDGRMVKIKRRDFGLSWPVDAK